MHMHVCAHTYTNTNAPRQSPSSLSFCCFRSRREGSRPITVFMMGLVRLSVEKTILPI